MTHHRRLACTFLALLLGSVGCRESVTDPNQAPVAAASIPPLTLTEGQVVLVELSPYFTDPDGDTLSYGATTDAAAAEVTVSGTQATVTAVSAGTATLSVTARDPGGLSAGQSTSVTVTPNLAPVATGAIPAVSLASGETVAVEVASYFSDPDGGALRYGASSSNTRVAIVSVTGLTMSVSGVAAGTTTLTVAARDPGGLTAAHEVAVTVVPGPTVGFREDFDADSLAGWDLGEAEAELSEGVLRLTHSRPGYAGRVNRELEAPINSWEVRARLGRARTDSVVASVIFATGHPRYGRYALDVGSGVGVEGQDTNYRFYVLDQTRSVTENPWVIIEGAYGTSDAVHDGAGEFTDIIASLEDGVLRVQAGDTELATVVLDDEYPLRLTTIGLWVFPLDGAADRTALFDWVEVSGTQTVGPARAGAAMAGATGVSRTLGDAPGGRGRHAAYRRFFQRHPRCSGNRLSRPQMRTPFLWRKAWGR